MNPFTHYLKYIICITVCPIWLFEFHISSRLFSVMCLHSILNCNFIIVKLQYDCVQQFFIIFIPKSKCNTVQAFIYDLFEQTLTLTCEWKNKIKEYHIVSLSRPTIMHMVSECSSEAFFQLKKYKRDEGKNGESSGRIATFERHTYRISRSDISAHTRSSPNLYESILKTLSPDINISRTVHKEWDEYFTFNFEFARIQVE